MKKILSGFVLVAVATTSFAQLRLPSLLSSNMVLQQQSSVPLWGWGSPADKIYVTTSWNNKTDSAVVTRDAKWKLMVQTPVAGGPYTITLKGGSVITLSNVMIGEVWICSGQSNMEYHSGYKGSTDIQPELKNAPDNNIHLFLQPRNTAAYPQDDIKAQWAVADSNALKSFSQVAYFFAKRLNNELNVPIGLIEAAWGGTPAEVWTPAEVISADDSLRDAAQKQVAQPWWPYYPGYAYNAMIAPVTNYNIAGAIWYQGEGNTNAPATYGRLLSSMISGWRKAWNKELPFYYVQIAPYTYGEKYAGSILQEQQSQVLALNNTGMVVTTDLVPDTTDIHPPMKRVVGERLAGWALAKTYNKSGFAYASPMYKSMSVEGNRATVDFNYAEDGLVVKGTAVTQLYIAGADKAFYPAQSKVSGNKLIVWSDQVQRPVAVRFAFSNAAVSNLFSKSGLPVTPFRTDNWNLK